MQARAQEVRILMFYSGSLSLKSSNLDPSTATGNRQLPDRNFKRAFQCFADGSCSFEYSLTFAKLRTWPSPALPLAPTPNQQQMDHLWRCIVVRAHVCRARPSVQRTKMWFFRFIIQTARSVPAVTRTSQHEPARSSVVSVLLLADNAWMRPVSTPLLQELPLQLVGDATALNLTHECANKSPNTNQLYRRFLPANTFVSSLSTPRMEFSMVERVALRVVADVGLVAKLGPQWGRERKRELLNNGHLQ